MVEYFGAGVNASFFAPVIENTPELIVPSVSIYEVTKRILLQSNESNALRAAATMAQGIIIDLNMPIAISAAKISIKHKIPMADSIILATARAYNATLWTQDVDLKVDGVQYIEKK